MCVELAEGNRHFRILSLDGGGAKGFYSLGVLREIEAMFNCRLCEVFDLIYGTSTGSIIGSLLAAGKTVDEIHDSYKEFVPTIMRCKSAADKSNALSIAAAAIFENTTFSDFKTGVGVVATKWDLETPMIFKGNIQQAHGRTATFVPGFGVSVSEAVQASCSAYPFFEKKRVTTSAGDDIMLVDGGYCANNPTLYAIADAVNGLHKNIEDLRVVSVGVGVYPEPKSSLFSRTRWVNYLLSVQLLQKTLEINTQSMDQLRKIIYGGIKTIRISDTFEKPEMATDLFEYNMDKLNLLRQRGSESFAKRENEIQQILLG
ncbi:patatin-like phospholipase family protein [Dyadobacter sp. CY347]|uniref:patatin-like phospholipase family protein n=1 Tax=Dyadobacter sp. CY347 TaxID=2909336 RepID=UPI001F216710|nr:patatin-like phospholipase family protein [Dyadobacter sp. CY347]MCF2491136.1 patatin-like phospholipase family protein [Dyadobacter sp. CY347]